MRQRLGIAAGVAALVVMVLAPGASATVDRLEVPIAGDGFICDSTTYTVVEGVIRIKQRIDPGKNLTVTIRPVGAIAEDEEGNRVKLVGAESVSGVSKQNGEVFTTVFNLTLVSLGGGGAVGRVSEVFHLSVNGNNLNIVERSAGGCEGPIPPA